MGNLRKSCLLMMKNLLIVFTKNIELGKVKTRLAASIGDTEALKIYKQLVNITERETLKVGNTDIHIYYTNHIDEKHWQGQSKFIQVAGDLGNKMGQAFKHGFELGYERIVGIGSDLPDINCQIIEEAFTTLESNNSVFGPAEDGGYYLLGMQRFYPSIFDNKPWSTENLLKMTLDALENANCSTSLLKELNDVDTLEDLEGSSLNI